MSKSCLVIYMNMVQTTYITITTTMKKTIVLACTNYHMSSLWLTQLDHLSCQSHIINLGLSVVMLQALFLSDTPVIVERTTVLNKEAPLQWLCLWIKYIFKSITDILDRYRQCRYIICLGPVVSSWNWELYISCLWLKMQWYGNRNEAFSKSKDIIDPQLDIVSW